MDFEFLSFMGLELITGGYFPDSGFFDKAREIKISGEEIASKHALSIDSTVEEIIQMDTFNDFAAWRKNYLEQFRQIVNSLFDYAEGNELNVIEVGPGPKMFALDKKMVPLDRISKYDMIELSEHYYYKVRKKVQNKKTKNTQIRIMHDDIHSMNVSYPETYDVAFSSSSLDSTGHLGDALDTLSKFLKKDGLLIVTQDVYPEYNSILHLASQYSDGDVVAGINGKNDPVASWIKRDDGLFIPSASYLMDQINYHAKDFELVTSGIVGSTLTVPFKERDAFGRMKKKFKVMKVPSDCNSVSTYMDHDVFEINEDIGHGALQMTYFSDVLVARKL